MSLFVLKSENNEPMLVGVLGVRKTEGIYIEVDEDRVPEKYRVEKLRGEAVINDKYMRSNTFGIGKGKYFEKIAEPLDFEAIQKDKLEMLEDTSIRYNWNEVLKILEETDNNSVYMLNFELFEIKDNKYKLIARKILNEHEIRVREHLFKEYEKNFRGMYQFEVSIPFASLSIDQIKEIRESYGKRRTIVDLDGLKNIVNKYNLEIPKEESHCIFFSKKRTNFSGKHSEGINIYNKGINEIMTFAEATERWGLADSTLRKLITTNKLIEGFDYRKSGKVWLITKDAMIKIYGEERK